MIGIAQSSFPQQRESTAGAGTSSFPSDGGNPRRGGRRTHNRRRESTVSQSGFRRLRESTAPRRCILTTAGIHGSGPAMGSRLHGNDGRRRRTPQSSFPQQRESTAPQSSFPRRRESTAGGRRWVPVSTGTTMEAAGGALTNDGGRRRTHNRHSHNSGNPRPHIVIPATAGIHGGGPAMGSRLHGNDDGRPAGALTNGRWAAAHPQSSGGIPRNSGNRRWVPVTIVIRREAAANPRRRAGDGFTVSIVGGDD